MKLIVATSFFPINTHDKVPRFVKDQVEALLKHDTNLQVVIIAPHYRRLSKGSAHKRHRVHRFNYFWPRKYQALAGYGIMPAIEKNKLLLFQIPFLFLFETFSLLKLTIKEKPDYIYAHWFTPQGISASIVSFFTRTPYVYTSHSSDVAVWHKIPLLGKLVVRFFSANAQKITVVSKRSLAKLQSFYNNSQWESIKNKVEIIPMGVDFDTSKQVSKQALLKASKADGLRNKHIILFIGRLEEKKGVHYLLEALAQLQGKDNFHLLIVGDGTLRHKLEEKAVSLELTSLVTFCGFKGGEEKQALIKLADMLIVPSIITSTGDAEGLPVVLLEGLAAGKVCIATNVSGGDDILTDEKNGFLIEDSDPKAIAKAVEKVIALDKQSHTKLTREALKLASNYSWDTIAKKHYDFLFNKGVQKDAK